MSEAQPRSETQQSSYRQAEPVFPRAGIWAWLCLYATGAVLLFLVSVHLWNAHFGASEPLSFKTTLENLRSPFLAVVELGLLTLALAHGLIGLRRVVLDLEILKPAGSKILTCLIAAAGTALFCWGLALFVKLSSG